MAGITTPEIKPAGTREVLTCELCFCRFEFVHNGQWGPASCPGCSALLAQRRRGQAELWAMLAPEEEKLIEDILRMCK